jgi:CxxC motif-containing protein (DUF1111 family)
MDFYALKRWIYLAIAVSVSAVSCWGSARVTQAENDRRRDQERHSAKPDQRLFVKVGCAFCYMPMAHGDPTVPTLIHKPVNFYPDLVLARLGLRPADDILRAAARQNSRTGLR